MQTEPSKRLSAVCRSCFELLLKRVHWTNPRGFLTTFAERQRLVNKGAFDEMEFRYVAEDVDAGQDPLDTFRRKTGRDCKR